MKRAAPFLLFAGVTLAVFWKFLAFGHTMYAMSAVETQLGREPQEPRGWFKSSYRHHRISDNVVLLAGHLRLYNEGLKANELRLWNPYLLCGLPTYSDPMVHPFYPPNLLLHRIFSPDVAYELGLMLHLFFSGVAMFLLLRGAGRTELASTAGGLVWMLTGYNAMWFSTGILAGATVFGPLALLAILKGIETQDLRRAGLAAGAMGLAILGSHPQHAVLLFLLLLGWIAVAAPRPFAFRFGGLFALLSVGVGMAEILTRLDTIENGYRDPEFDRLSLYAAPARLATYAIGLLLGKVYFPGPGWEAEFAVYSGLAAVGLAVVGAVRRWSDRSVRYAAIAGAAAIAVAFVYPLAWLFTKIPLLNLSPPSRCLFLAGFAVAFLAAHGLEALAADLGRAPRGFAGCSIVFAAGALVFVGVDGAVLETCIGFTLATVAAFAAYRSRPAAAGLAFAAILFELLPPFLQFNAHGDSSLLSQEPDAVRAMKGPTRGTGVLGTTATTNKSDQWGNDLVTGNNLLALYGIENVGGFEAIIPRHYVAFALAAGGRISPAGRTVQFTKFDSPLLDAAGLQYVLLPPTLPMAPRFKKLETFGGVALYGNRDALPRARLVEEIRIAKDEAEAERLLRDPKFDPSREAVVQSDRPLPTGGGQVTWADPRRFYVKAAKAATLVVADTDYPGWEATIDGAPAPILRANVAFRAVEVPAGDHVVEFRFRPSSARHGFMASVFFLLLSIGVSLYRRQA